MNMRSYSLTKGTSTIRIPLKIIEFERRSLIMNNRGIAPLFKHI